MAVTIEDIEQIERFQDLHGVFPALKIETEESGTLKNTSEFSPVGIFIPKPDFDEVFARKLRRSLAKGREYLLSREKLAIFRPRETSRDWQSSIEVVILNAFLASSDPGAEKRSFKVDSSVSSGIVSLLEATDNLDTAITSYLSLKLLGCDPGMEFMRGARVLIAELGGPNSAAETTKLLLALFGQMPFPQVSRAIKRKNPAISLILAQKPFRQISPMLGVRELFLEPPQKSREKSILGRFFQKRALKTTESAFWDNLKSTKNLAFWDKMALAGLGLYDKTLKTLENSTTKTRFPAKMPQRYNGSWNNDLLETCATLTGLLEQGISPDEITVTSALNWILAEQNSDGGWGENSDSTPEMTAGAILVLLNAGKFDHPGVYRGIEYLLEVQETKGNWPNRLGEKSPGDDYETSSLALRAIDRYAANVKIANAEILRKDAPAAMPRPNLRLYAPEMSETSNVRIRNERFDREDSGGNEIRLRLISPPGLGRPNSLRLEKPQLRIFRG